MFKQPQPPRFQDHRERPFPQNLLQPAFYGVFRILSLVFLAACTIGYFHSLFAAPNDLIPEKTEFVEQRGVIKEAWFWTYHTLWQGATEKAQAKEYAKNEVDSQKFWAGFWVFLAALLVWLAFDTEKANHALSAFGAMFGTIFYLLLPNETIPDIIPVAGVADDAVVVLMGSAIAISSVLGYLRSNEQQRKREKDFYKSEPERHQEDEHSWYAT